jgi:hypothetical protein
VQFSLILGPPTTVLSLFHAYLIYPKSIFYIFKFPSEMTITQLYHNLPPFTQAGYAGILPLTTIYSPSLDCAAASAYTTSVWADKINGGDEIAILLDDGAHISSCYPSSYSKYQYHTGYYYSPGVCPSSYQYVATSVQSDDSEQPLTLILCCRS